MPTALTIYSQAEVDAEVAKLKAEFDAKLAAIQPTDMTALTARVTALESAIKAVNSAAKALDSGIPDTA